MPDESQCLAYMLYQYQKWRSCIDCYLSMLWDQTGYVNTRYCLCILTSSWLTLLGTFCSSRRHEGADVSLTFTTQVCTNQGSSKVLKSIHQLVRGDSSKTKEVNFWSIESSPMAHLFALLSVLSSQSLTWSPLLATGLFQTTCSYFTSSLCPLVPFLGF